MQNSAQTIDDERSKSFVLDFFGDDQQRLRRSRNLVEQWKEINQIGDFLLIDQHVRIFQDALRLLWISHEIWREVSLIEAHAFDIIQRGVRSLAFFDFNNAICAHFMDRFSNQIADF